METEKLFMSNPYMKEFEAHILKIEEIDKECKIILDRTCFYPESGGQVGDTGYINDIKVIDTKYDQDKKHIIHIIENNNTNFKEGDKVAGKIDWERRYKIMKLHAASHVMEYFLFKIFGKLKLIGTNVNDKRDSSTYEYSTAFSPENLKDVERQSNEFISKGCKIDRIRSDRGWLWRAGNIEMFCAGTHPNDICEIGQISIKRKSGGKGKEKVLTSIAE